MKPKTAVECWALVDPIFKAVWSASIRTSKAAAIKILTRATRKTWAQQKRSGWKAIRVHVCPIDEAKSKRKKKAAAGSRR
jgi:hypothetical protein